MRVITVPSTLSPSPFRRRKQVIQARWEEILSVIFFFVIVHKHFVGFSGELQDRSTGR